MGKTRAKSKRARERRRAANQAAKAERAAAEERERDLRRRVVHEVARGFLKKLLPRVERIGAFCFWLKSDRVREIRADRDNEYSMMRETLLFFQRGCRDCLEGEEWGKWHCTCPLPRASDVEVMEEEYEDDEEYEEEYEWEEEEEEEEDEELDEGFWSPALWMRKQQQPENISPEIAALDLDGMKQTRRALFLEK